jgi:hypothetical protein
MTPTIIPIPTIQAPTIDTLISSIALFSTVLLAVISAIGVFLVWNGFILRDRADKDLKKIEDTKDQAVKMFIELQKISYNWQKFADENMKNANESIKRLSSIVTQAGNDANTIKEAKVVVREWKKNYSDYSKVSNGTK